MRMKMPISPAMMSHRTQWFVFLSNLLILPVTSIMLSSTLSMSSFKCSSYLFYFLISVLNSSPTCLVSFTTLITPSSSLSCSSIIFLYCISTCLLSRSLVASYSPSAPLTSDSQVAAAAAFCCSIALYSYESCPLTSSLNSSILVIRVAISLLVTLGNFLGSFSYKYFSFSRFSMSVLRVFQVAPMRYFYAATFVPGVTLFTVSI